MKRRNFLGKAALTIGATVAGEIVFSNLHESIASATDKVEWKYTGEEGPKNWGNLSPEYEVCQVGAQQSPIDLKQAINSDLSDLVIESTQVPLTIQNNGHTIQVATAPGNTLTLDGNAFELIQFHFHHPSEHVVASQAYPMEVHFVHRSAAGTFAVLGVFLKEGQENLALNPIWNNMSATEQSEAEILGNTIEVLDLLPKDQSIYRYFGSLTTPPCSELVQWVVFQDPIEVSKAQIEKFKQIFPLNARPVQPLNRRFILLET